MQPRCNRSTAEVGPGSKEFVRNEGSQAAPLASANFLVSFSLGSFGGSSGSAAAPNVFPNFTTLEVTAQVKV